MVPSTSAKPVLKALDDIYVDYGQPASRRTDNGPPFDSEVFTEFSKVNGIEHVKTFPYHPQANPAENFMRPLGKTMKAANFNREDKEKALKELLAGYRATPHHATGRSPGDLLFHHGYKKDFPRGPVLSKTQRQQAIEQDQHLKKKKRWKCYYVCIILFIFRVDTVPKTS